MRRIVREVPGGGSAAAREAGGYPEWACAGGRHSIPMTGAIVASSKIDWVCSAASLTRDGWVQSGFGNSPWQDFCGIGCVHAEMHCAPAESSNRASMTAILPKISSCLNFSTEPGCESCPGFHRANAAG